MYKYLVLVAFITIFVFLNAQLFDALSLISQSAITPEGDIFLRTSYFEALDIFEIEALTFSQNQTYSSVFSMFNNFEQRAIVKSPDSDLNFIGIRAESDFFNFVIPWQLQNHQTEQTNLYIRAGVSETGLLDDEVLDLKYQSFALTETSLWVKIENVAADYPFMSWNLTNFYAYGAVVIKPDTVLENIDWENLDLSDLDLSLLEDLSAYALINLNIPLLLNAGLFKVPLSILLDPSSIDLFDFLPIGSINSSINNGAMMVGVDFSTLANDPDFGEWPSLTSSLLVIPVIINIQNPLTNINFNIDIGSPTLVYCSPYSVLNQINTTPQINLNYDTPLSKLISYSNTGGFYPIVAEFRGDGYVIRGINGENNFYQNAIFAFNHFEPFGDGQFVFSTDNENFITLDYYVSENDQTIPANDVYFSIFPNPIRENFFSLDFKMPVVSSTKIEIYNVRGQKMINYDYTTLNDNTALKLIIDDFASGIYFVRVINNEFSHIQRILVIRN
ncbi:MAG: T9SS type A sorting domain-containing protein [Candidatus Cloacimonetes bacterium]|nr:T9SS type A sorting domain-containing protein [Candidatus Cloacimonadota bacterium]